MARILIIDDDPDVVEASRIPLERAGHQISSAGSRQEGMSAISKQNPDLLILDVMMDRPDDGVAMAQELRRSGFSAPILMLTNLSHVTGMDFGKDEDVVPVDEFLAKPLDPSTLVSKVDELLKKEG
ncbi:MAG: response regulator transcription factor [Phycisphaerae bacterium]|nr:response regulator transcription factor [Phycisphaerae bacterium]